MVLVLRFLFLIPLGFVAACIAAAFAMIWPFLGPLPGWDQDPAYWIVAAEGFLIQSVQVGSVSFLPWLIFAALTEAFGLRSLILHCLAGLAGAFTVIRFAYEGSAPHSSVQTAILVAGLAYALVYWLVAGHGAGGRRRSSQRAGVRRIETANPEKTEAKT